MYSVSELAQKAKVSKRTIRFYEQQGLLCSHFDEHRKLKVYDELMYQRVQIILFLQMADFNLQEISKVIAEGISLDILLARKDALKEKQLMIQSMLTMLDKIEQSEIAIDETVDLYALLLQEQQTLSVNEQYSDRHNFQSRLSLHTEYSTNQLDWHTWVFQQLSLKQGMSVLEVGCGTGELWNDEHCQKLPKDTKILLTDKEQMMLDVCQNRVRNYASFRPTRIFDVTEPTLFDEQFDIIIVNHVLQLFDQSTEILERLAKMLKLGGHIFASTVGEKHMFELEQLIQKVDKNMTLRIERQVQNFSLEQGSSAVPDSLAVKDILLYEDSLQVTDAKPLMDYIYSTRFIGNIQQFDSPDCKRTLQQLLQHAIAENELGMHIQKHTGMFVLKKGENNEQ